MGKYKFKVLFKNGVEKEYECESEDDAIASLLIDIELVYKDRGKGVVQLGNGFIMLTETVSIEIEEVIEDENN